MKPKGCKVQGCAGRHEAKGYCQPHYKRWKLHGDPLVDKRARSGDGWIQDGYKYFTVNGKNVREHNLIAERAFGRPLPNNVDVHHIDENRLNNDPSNLVICSRKYHKLLHTRMNAYKACGHWDWRKCPYCGKHDDTKNMRGERCGRFVHRKCSADARVSAYQKRNANVIHV